MNVQKQHIAPAPGQHESLSASRLVADISALVTPPAVCVKMFELVHSGSATATDIGEVVALDPNLTARLLRIVNSSYYGFQSTIKTIPRAVTVLGTRDLYNLVLAISAARTFSKLSDGLASMDAFWKHSVFCALAARELGRHFRIADADRLFVAGLLHEIGLCVIYSQVPQARLAMQTALEAGEAALHDAEIEHLGFSHAIVGAMVLEQWQLPVELRSAVQHHHSPADSTTGRIETAVVHLADVLASRSMAGALGSHPNRDAAVDNAVWRLLDSSPDLLDEEQIVADVDTKFGEAMRNLLPSNRHQ